MGKSNASRRKFLKNTALLTLGATAVNIKAANASVEGIAPCHKTTLDFYGQGPFYTPNAPIRENSLIDKNEPGQRMVISGRVMNLDCTEVIPDAMIDIWHANDNGTYDNQGFNLRGRITTNAEGFYMFETIKPGKYLNGASFRPSHIHFKITPQGSSEITTQLYFSGDSDIPGDAAASINSGEFDASSRIIELVENNQGVLEGTWDIVIQGNGISTSNDIHLNQGIIYSVSPNPMVDVLEINYGIFKDGKVSIQVFDLKGSLVADIAKLTLTPEKYSATWKADATLPEGTYFVVLKINQLQVHYLKVIKTNRSIY